MVKHNSNRGGRVAKRRAELKKKREMSEIERKGTGKIRRGSLMRVRGLKEKGERKEKGSRKKGNN